MMAIGVGLGLAPGWGREDQRTADAPQATELGEVVVRAEAFPGILSDIQSTPGAVSGFTGADLSGLGVRTAADVLRMVPNVTVNAAGGGESTRNVTFGVRGYVEDSVRQLFNGGQSQVGFYYDDIPFIESYSRNVPVQELDSAVFHRFPQNTAYGTPAPAGLLILTPRPLANTWEGMVSHTYGSYNLQRVDVHTQGGLVSDKLFFGFDGRYESRDGYYNNTFLDDSFGDQEAWSGLARMKWNLAPELSLTLTGGYDHYNDDAVALPLSTAPDIFVFPSPINGLSTQENSLFAAKWEWTQETWRLLAVTSYRTSDQAQEASQNYFLGLPPTNPPVFLAQSSRTLENITQEIRAESTEADALFRWVLGFFFSDRSNEGLPSVAVLSAPFPAGRGIVEQDLEQQTYALFGEATRTLWEQLDLTAGLRLEYVENHDVSRSAPPQFTATTADERVESWGVLPTFGAAWWWTEAQMTYFRAAASMVPGGGRLAARTLNNYDPQRSWNFELGHKASWFEDRLTVNPALFYNDIEDYQGFVSTGPFLSGVQNFGSAHAMGAELDITARPLKGWMLYAAFGLTEAEIDEGSFQGATLDGTRLVNTPEYSLRSGTSYRHELGGDMGLVARFDVMVNGPTNLSEQFPFEQSAYTVASSQVGWEWKHGGIYLFGSNLFDAQYFTSFAGNSSTFGRVQVGDPQTFGIRTTLKF